MIYPDDFVNEIILGDCLEVMKNIPDKSVDLVLTDPPYLIDYKTNHRKNKDHDFCFAIENDNNNNSDLIVNYVKECYRILKNNSAIYMFCSFDKVDFFKQSLEKYFNLKNMIIWVKNNWTAGDLKNSFGKQYEILFLGNKGKRIINGKRLSDVWSFKRIVGSSQIHQNQKPLDLLKLCISKHSNKNDIVFDGFLGSGTTAIASIDMDRKYIGIEKNKKCYDDACKRVRNHKVQGILFFNF